jgi:hypothetical protein
MALDVIDISAEGLAAYVMPGSRTGRPREDLKAAARLYRGRFSRRGLTECEAFLLRSGAKAIELEA